MRPFDAAKSFAAKLQNLESDLRFFERSATNTAAIAEIAYATRRLIFEIWKKEAESDSAYLHRIQVGRYSEYLTIIQQNIFLIAEKQRET